MEQKILFSCFKHIGPCADCGVPTICLRAKDHTGNCVPICPRKKYANMDPVGPYDEDLVFPLAPYARMHRYGQN